VSGFADAAVAERVPSGSRAGFLEKPFTPTTLLRAVREALERAPAH
jgi:FixJ family two-component response regulator